MPQPVRKDPALQRAQEKELKRARGAMSCAECRRLKLKCDKTVPCSSCKRRGCAAICPNGSLITGQGTRFVLADTEKLHHKISDMSERIRQLEDALAILQSTHDSEPHPLLQPDLMKIKSSIDLHSAATNAHDAEIAGEDSEDLPYIDSFGTLAISADGGATFYGRSAGHEASTSVPYSVLFQPTDDLPLNRAYSSNTAGKGENTPTRPQDKEAAQPPHSPPTSSLPTPILQYSAAFPFPPSEYQGLDVETLAESFLPTWPEALRLCELYLESAPWFFGPVTRRQLIEELLPTWYPQARAMAGLPDSPSPSGTNHELALLFIIFVFGAINDINLPPPPDNADATHYFELGQATLNLDSLLHRPGSIAAVQTLSLMAIYKGMCAEENSIESTWAMFGMATRMAQSVGLHHDTARWNLSPAEVQKRRALFWELFITDSWQSLATGRLPMFSLPFVDCELPEDPDQTLSDDGTVIPSFSAWKARFGSECVSAVVQGVLTARAPKYAIILELDRKIRDMQLPHHTPKPSASGLPFAQTMSNVMPNNYRFLTLLYVHRGYFSIAVQNQPQDPLKSAYAPSFLAGYRSSCEMISLIRAQFARFPAQIARFWVLWTHSFSASAMLASVVTRCPSSKVASAAFVELRRACELFEQAAPFGGRAKTFLPILQRMQKKAHQVFVDAHSGIMPPIRNDIFSSSQKIKDDLDIFSGKTHTVTTKSKSSRPTRLSPPSSQTGTSSTTTTTHTAYTASMPAFANVHPTLVDELHQFEGQLNAQIQGAYQLEQDTFFNQLMGRHPNAPQLRMPQHTSSTSHPSMSPTYAHAPFTTAPMAPGLTRPRDMEASNVAQLPYPNALMPLHAVLSQNEHASYIPTQNPQYWPQSSHTTHDAVYFPSEEHNKYPAELFAPPQVHQYQQQQQSAPTPAPLHYQTSETGTGSSEERRLQEGWTTFMQSVGSPPRLD